MINKNCRYSYYPRPYTKEMFAKIIELNTAEIINLLNTSKISGIIGYSDIILIAANVDNMPIKLSASSTIMSVNRFFYSKYNYELLSKLWDISFGINDIINTYLDHMCKSKEEMQNIFMAKILGGE